MAEEDERELLRKLEPLRLEVWPVLSDPGFSAPLASAETRLVQPAYYLAAGDVTGYPIKKGPERGKWKIDEVLSPVIFLQRSLPDEHGELRDRKSTRLNSSHTVISYAVFCLKKKN